MRRAGLVFYPKWFKVVLCMTTHLQKGEAPESALRRACREHLGLGQAQLRRSRHPASVHGARKEIKKVRALFRLVRGEIGRRAYRQAAKGLRRVAALLAATRDARVRFKAFEQLAGTAAKKKIPRLHRALRKEYRREYRRFHADDSVALARQALQRIGRRVSGLKLPAADWTVIEPGLQQSHGRGQRWFRRVRASPSSEHLHEWRKQVKILGYQLRLLCPRWPAATRQRQAQLETLGKVLGEDHDLLLLKQFAAEQGPARERKALKPLIEARQKQLRSAALKLGALVYREAPAELCRQLGKDWQQWSGRRQKK